MRGKSRSPPRLWYVCRMQAFFVGLLFVILKKRYNTVRILLKIFEQPTYMLEVERKKKQYTFMGITVVVLASLVFLIILVVTPGPTCNDAKKNQDETGVDCGGVCGSCPEAIAAVPLSVTETGFVRNNDGSVDAYAQIYNPNDLYGVGKLTYVFSAVLNDGTTQQMKTGTTYILPKEKKFVIESKIPAVENVSSFRFSLDSDVSWVQFTDFETPQFSVVNQKYETGSSTPYYSKVSALIRNDSPFDFATVPVTVILRDQAGNIVAVNKTEYNTVKSGELRDFTLPYFQPIQGEVSSVDVEVSTNVFNNQNFIRRYLPGGKYQEVTNFR